MRGGCSSGGGTGVGVSGGWVLVVMVVAVVMTAFVMVAVVIVVGVLLSVHCVVRMGRNLVVMLVVVVIDVDLLALPESAKNMPDSCLNFLGFLKTYLQEAVISSV